jgi:hypothetical protein
VSWENAVGALQSFLTDKRDGGTFDSHGTFTLNQDAIASKLAEYGLGSQAACLLRLIQMGLAGGAREVDIVFGLEAIEIVLEGELPSSAFYKELHRPLRVLLSGCLHAGFSAVVVGSGRKRWRLDRAFHMQEAEGSFRNGVAFVFNGSYDRNIRKELSSRLRASPAKVTVDSKPINQTRAPRRCLLELEIQSLDAPFVESVWVKAEKKRHRADDFFAPGQVARPVKYIDHGDGFLTENRLHDQWDVLLYAKRIVPVGGLRRGHPATVALLNIPLEASSARGLFFVKEGVIVGRVETALGLDGYVSAEGLNTDLSGLNLVQNSKLQKRLDFLQAQVRSLQPSSVRSSQAWGRPGLSKLRERLLPDTSP